LSPWSLCWVLKIMPINRRGETPGVRTDVSAAAGQNPTGKGLFPPLSKGFLKGRRAPRIGLRKCRKSRLWAGGIVKSFFPLLGFCLKIHSSTHSILGGFCAILLKRDSRTDGVISGANGCEKLEVPPLILTRAPGWKGKNPIPGRQILKEARPWVRRK
jgi:hypothetical protein